MPKRPPQIGEHRSRRGQNYEQTRGNARQRGYTAAWDRLRAAYRLAHPLCAQCLREGRTTIAVDVDHIQPIGRGGALLDESNLQSLCRRCHNIKTASERAGRPQSR